MAANKFSNAQREAHLATVAELYLAGTRQVDIAEEIGVSQQQISGYLKTLQGRWQIHAAEAIDVRKARELARIDRVEREHWQAWARSQEDAETETVTTGTQNLTTTKRVGQVGDPRFLQGVMQCIEMRLKIVGGFAPAEVVVRDWRKEAADAGVDPDAFAVKVGGLWDQVPAVVTEGNPDAVDEVE